MSDEATVDATDRDALGVDLGGCERGAGQAVGPDLGTEPGYLAIVEGVDTILI